MARNRKRRGDSRPTDAPPSRPGVATVRAQREPRARPDEAPEPMQHASPDADIAEAQLAAAESEAERPDGSTPPAGEPVADAGPAAEVNRRSDDSQFDDDGLDEDGGDDEPIGDDGPAGGPPDRPRRRGGGGGGGDDSGGGLTPHSEAGPASAPRRRNGLVAFAQGSWRELQRVQWPDRRQVIQATGVVIGFVIVAGAYLGVADWVATKIVHFILS